MIFKSEETPKASAKLTLTECPTKCHGVAPQIHSKINRIDVSLKTKGKGDSFRAAIKLPPLDAGEYRLTFKLDAPKSLVGLYATIEHAMGDFKIEACVEQVDRDVALEFTLERALDTLCFCVGSARYPSNDPSLTVSNIILSHKRLPRASSPRLELAQVPVTTVLTDATHTLTAAQAPRGLLSKSASTVLNTPRGLVSLSVLGRGSVEDIHTRLVVVSGVSGVRLGHMHISTQHQEHTLRLHLPEDSVSIHVESRVPAHVQLDRVAVTMLSDPSPPPADVGVVIPMRNCEQFIERCVQSLALQTVRPAHVYIVDDASDDASVEIVRALTEAYADTLKISLIRNAVRMGPYVSKNRVLEMYGTRHAFWALQDADDYSLCNRLEAQLGQLLRKPEVMLSYCNGLRVVNGEVVMNRGLRSRRCYAAAVFKVELLEQVGYYESVLYGADDEFNTRVKSLLGPQAIYDTSDALYYAELWEHSLTNHPESRVDLVSGSMSELRKQYADSFVAPRMFMRPLSVHPATPPALRATPKINVHMATYPPRLSSALSVITDVKAALSDFDFRFTVCLNGVGEIPDAFVDIANDERFNVLVPNADLKDNGKFVGVGNGFTFWVDDDITYTKEYFTSALRTMMRSEPNTPFCVHGFSGTTVVGPSRTLYHFEVALPAPATCTIAGTGTLFMWVQNSDFIDAVREIPQYELTGAVDLLFGFVCAIHGKRPISVARDFELLSPKVLTSAAPTLYELNQSRVSELDSVLNVINAVRNSNASLRKRKYAPEMG
jgi:hypothetical protein